MMVGIDALHPDDVLYFAEVASAMRRVALKHKLPLRSIGHLPDEKAGFDTDRWGDCDSHGNIRMMLRAKEKGQWTERLSPDAVWNVAAHELAHLRHFNHSAAHEELWGELMSELRNQKEDHKERVLRKLVKLQTQAQGEAKIGNMEAADAFARMINKMLLENELRPSDIDYARAGQDDPVIELKTDLERYGMKVKSVRSPWKEELARVVAKANLCTYLIAPGTNVLWFVGTRSHATVAEYAFGVLAAAAEKMALKEYTQYYHNLWVANGKKNVSGDKVRGFSASWLRGFITQINIRFEEERKAAEVTHVAEGGEPGTALVRLNGAMQKVAQYIDDKFGKRKRAASSIGKYYSYHAEGQAMGKAAADRMALGRRGLTSTPVKGRLGS